MAGPAGTGGPGARPANSGVDSEIGSARPWRTGRTRNWPVGTDGGDWFAGCRRTVALPSRAGREDRVGGPRGGRHVGDDDRKGVITEVHGEGGAPPYLVRWENGHDSVFMPSSDTVVEHRPAQGAAG
jgi:Domain of unknown function (DUF1918)